MARDMFKLYSMTDASSAPTVSVLMPAYNGETYLLDSIGSILDWKNAGGAAPIVDKFVSNSPEKYSVAKFIEAYSDDDGPSSLEDARNFAARLLANQPTVLLV